MAHKRIDITSADTKQVGFDYQYLYFMDRLLQLSPGDEIGYEALDDVHVISSTTGETAYIQTKHTIDLSSDGTLVNLTTLSEDLWKTLSNWSQLIKDPQEQRNTESSQLSFINRSKFILVTNRNTTNNSVSLLLDKTKENDCAEANVRDELMKFRGSSKSNTIHGYIDNICKLAPTVLLHFFRKVDLVSTDIDLFEDIRKKIKDKMIADDDVDDVLSRLYYQLKRDFFKSVQNRKHQVITYGEWRKKYQSVFNSVRTTLLPFRSYTPALPQHLEMQPFAKELFEIDAISLDNFGLAELADFTTAFLSLRNQLSDWYDEGKIDASTVKKFHDNAFEIWKSLHRGSHRATKKDNALDQNNALSCFDEVMKKELKILATELGISLSRGEFIMLANEEEIGWKYMWCEKWSVKGVNDDFPLF